MRRLVVALVAFLAAALVVGLLMLGGHDPHATTGPGLRPAHAPEDAAVVEARGTAPEQQAPPSLGLQGAPRKAAAGNRRLGGRVLDARGAPAVGTRVEAFEDGPAGARLAEASTAADGSFTLEGLPPRLLRFLARAAGSNDDEAQAWAHPDVGVLELRLAARVHAIEVVVVDERGVRVPDFLLSVSVGGGFVRGREGSARLVLRTSFSGRNPRTGDSLVVRVRDPRDAAGRALDLVGLVERRVTLPAEPLKFILADCPAWRGSLRSADGRPLAGWGARFQFLRPAGSEGDPRGEAATWNPALASYQSDDQGRLEVPRPHPDAALEVTVRGDKVWLPAHVTRRAGEDLGEIVLRAAVHVTVEVRGPSGAGVRNAEVRATDEQLGYAGREVGMVPIRSPWTDEEGRILLTGLDPERTYVLTVDPSALDDWSDLPPGAVEELIQAEGLAPFRRSGWRPADTVVTLETAREITGVVHDEAGRPVPGAWVEARSEAGSRVTRRADQRGEFSLPGVPKGPVSLAAAWTQRGLGLTPRGVQVHDEARAGQQLVLSGARTARVRVAVDLTQEVLRAITRQAGALYEQAGSPGWRRADGCVLGAFEVEAPAVTAIEGEAATDAERGDGSRERGFAEAVIEGPEPGRRYAFWLHLGAKGHLWAEFAAGSDPVTLVPTPGETLEVEVVGCPPDVSVSVEMRDGLGRPLGGGRRLAEGRLRLGGVPAGEWDVRVSVDVPAVRSGTARVRTGIPGRVELQPAR